MDRIGPSKEFGFLPIPRHCRYDPGRPFVFTGFLNAVFACTATFTVAVLYYPTPLLVQFADHFKITYEQSTRVPSLLQAGYLIGLVFVTPLADLVPRRSLILVLVFTTATLSIGLATVRSFAGFEAISFLAGLGTVTPQIMVPLAADLAPPEKRARCVGIVVTGLMSGLLFGRVIAGIIGHWTSFRNIYWMGMALQYIVLAILWWVMPAYPRKTTNLSYFQILKSMVVLLLTKPLLVQACLMSFCGAFIFVSWWNTLTFLLSASPFDYNTFDIGLFGLAGIVTITSASYVGMLNDRINPWVGTLLGITLQIVVQSIALGGAGLSLGPVITTCIFVDLAQQMMQISNQTRIYSIDPLARGRLNGCYMMFTFLGQTAGSSGGPRLFLRDGWRASYALNVGMAFVALLLLLVRGPNARGWIGWGGDYSLGRKKPEQNIPKDESQVTSEVEAGAKDEASFGDEETGDKKREGE